MAFRSASDAAESRRAVAAFMGLATRDQVMVATTDHFDLTPAVANQPPLVPSRGGGMVPAPDVLLINPTLGMVVGVEIEARSIAQHYPGATFAAVGKLAPHIEIDLSSSVYARAVKGQDFDAASSWGQRDIADLLRELAAGRLKCVETRRGLLLILKQHDFHDLDQLWRQVRGEA
jgi:hypothetical protein